MVTYGHVAKNARKCLQRKGLGGLWSRWSRWSWGVFSPKKKSKKNKISLEYKEEKLRGEYGENFWRDHRLFSPVSVFDCSINHGKPAHATHVSG